MFKASLVTAFLAIVAFSPAFAAQDGDQGEGAGGREHGRAPHDDAGGKWQGRGPDGRDWQAGRGDNNHSNWQGGKPNRNWHEGRSDNNHGNWGTPHRNWQEGRADNDEGDWEGGHHYYSHRATTAGMVLPTATIVAPTPTAIHTADTADAVGCTLMQWVAVTPTGGNNFTLAWDISSDKKAVTDLAFARVSSA